MSLEVRLRKIEAIRGRGRAPSENEFRADMGLIDRHFEAVVLPELSRKTGYGPTGVIAAVADGTLSPEEGASMGSAISVQSRMLELSDLERRAVRFKS